MIFTLISIKLLQMNQQHLIKAYDSQNKQNYEDSVKSLEQIYKNFHVLGVIADRSAFTPLIIRESRELLSQAHLEKVQNKFPCKVNLNYEYEKSYRDVGTKIKQKKTKWSGEEQELFLQGLELYGPKSNKKNNYN